MKIVKAGWEFIDRPPRAGRMKAIETAGRLCYKSESKISAASAPKFVRNLILHHHDAMLEHGDYVFRIKDQGVYKAVAEGMQMLRDATGMAPNLIMTDINGRPIISGNIRAWRELLQANAGIAYYFAGHIDDNYRFDLPEYESVDPDQRIEEMSYIELEGRERMAHYRMGVKFTCDRGISHEFVRHRQFAFAQESTRYCNYASGKFGSEITVVSPSQFGEDCYWAGTSWEDWESVCISAEHAYKRMMERYCTAQEARVVLPTSTKTELIMTGNLYAWKHFFDLRALEKTGPAHPQAKEIALPALEGFRDIFPDIFAEERA